MALTPDDLLSWAQRVETMQELLVVELLVVGVFAASTLYIHFRGRDRFKLTRQLGHLTTFTGPYNALMYLFSAVRAKPFVPVAEFPALAPLRDHWPTIRGEALALLADEQIRGAKKHNDIAFNSFFKRGWGRFYLKWYGDFFPSAVESCPETVDLVRAIPSVNAAMFAFLPAGSRLGRHRDPFAGSLRYHLGLLTPNSDDCFIIIDGQRYSWRDGEDVMFDETFIHSAQNKTDQDRLILFCDIARPLRTPVLRVLNRWVTRYVVRISATQNTDTESVGILNRVSGFVYRYGQFMQRLKALNRRLFVIGKWVVMLGMGYLLFVITV